MSLLDRIKNNKKMYYIILLLFRWIIYYSFYYYMNVRIDGLIIIAIYGSFEWVTCFIEIMINKDKLDIIDKI